VADALGIAVAILAFRFLLPVDPSRRLCSVLASIVHDLNSMVAADSLSMKLLANCCDHQPE